MSTVTTLVLGLSHLMAIDDGALVSVGSHRLFLHCTGPVAAQPVVILEAGGGGTSGDWTQVRALLGDAVRSCAYDRAGSGRSDVGPSPRTLNQEVIELHALLAAASVRPPYVLVGQSIGALNNRFYTSRFPNDVVGLVFVDPTHESAVLGSLRYGGFVRLREKAQGRPVPEPRLDRVVDALVADDTDYLAEELQLLFAARAANPVPLGDRPLVVLAAGVRPPPPPGTSEEQWRSLRDERDAQVADLASLSRNARYIRDPTSGHSMQMDDPPIVARAIEDVLSAIKRSGG